MPEFRVRYEQVVTYEVTVKAENEGAAFKAVRLMIEDDSGINCTEVDSTRPNITEVINSDGVVSKPLFTTFPIK
jgi:hypothetical protein